MGWIFFILFGLCWFTAISAIISLGIALYSAHAISLIGLILMIGLCIVLYIATIIGLILEYFNHENDY